METHLMSKNQEASKQVLVITITTMAQKGEGG